MGAEVCEKVDGASERVGGLGRLVLCEATWKHETGERDLGDADRTFRWLIMAFDELNLTERFRSSRLYIMASALRRTVCGADFQLDITLRLFNINPGIVRMDEPIA